MAEITLELLMESHPIYGAPQVITLGAALHIHKRLEQFIYTNTIRDESIPIVYLRNPEPTSARNLSIVDKSHSVPLNSQGLLRSKKHDVVVSTGYSSPYASILATEQFYVDERGRQRPLFYRHELPEGTTEATLYQYKQGNKELVETGYKINIAERSIYTSFTNKFDPATGSARLFYVTASVADGQQINTLLNAGPATREATWEDIDLDTGDLKLDFPVFSRTQSSGGYRYQFNKGSRWFIKPQEKRLVVPRLPLSLTPASPWYLRITNGSVSGLVNGSVHHYSIPEYLTQPFVPYFPVKFGSKEDLLFVNRRTLAANRQALKVEPIEGLHMEIIIKNEDDEIIRAFTTNTALEGQRYSNLDVFYESDKISSWDNYEGVIALSTDVLPAWKYHAKFYYEANDFEYTYVNLNPINNRKLRDHTYVFYVIPDVNEADRAVHHLVINPDGIVIETSQSLGLSYPNHQLTNGDGSYNEDTVIGLPYFSELEECWLDRYGAGFNNTYAYMILAEVTGMDPALPEDQVEVDVRQPGAVIRPEIYEEAVLANPKILQSSLGYGEFGQVVPETNVMVLDVPLSLTSDYGGLMEAAQVETALRTHMPVNGYAVINWVYPEADISATSYVADQISVSVTWEGEYDYKLYRRSAEGDPWVLIYTWSNPAEGTLTYTDTDVVTNRLYEYTVALVENSIEYPKTEEIVIKAR